MDWNLIIDKLAIPVLLTVGGWVWTRIRGKDKDISEARSLLDDIVENFIYELLDKYPLNVSVETYLKGSRAYIEQEVWKAASKRGIPRNKTTERLLHAAIERGTAILAKEVARLRQLDEERRHEREMAEALK